MTLPDTNPSGASAPPYRGRGGPADELTRLMDWLAGQIRRPAPEDPLRRLTTVAATLYNAIAAALDAHPITWMPDGRAVLRPLPRRTTAPTRCLAVRHAARGRRCAAPTLAA